MRVFVTGGAGYIGSIGVEKLLDAGHEVVVLDNMRTGHPASVERAAIVIRAICAMQPIINDMLARIQPDAVVHFAGATIVPESVPNLTSTTESIWWVDITCSKDCAGGGGQ